MQNVLAIKVVIRSVSSSGLQPFLYNHSPTGTSLENRPLPVIFALSENIFLFCK